jgi:hypothetical protein
MRWTLLRFALFVLTGLAVVMFGRDIRALAQAPQQTPRVEPRLTVTVEVFCSDTKLRTSNARIRWSLPRAALDASGLASLAAAKQSLEVTVYKNGFDKGLLASLSVSQATPDRPVVPQAQTRQPPLRAFQIALIGVEQPRTPFAPDAAGEMSAIVEDLEPGVNYTWRIAIDTAAGRIVSPSVTSQALTCPADLVPTTGVPARKP